jgi:nucleoid-associated protein YgaU
MAKYINDIKIKTTDVGKQYYTTPILESYTSSDLDFTYTAQLGDRWDLLAHRYYGSARYWYVLARANGGVDGSIFITPGTIVTIPQTL